MKKIQSETLQMPFKLKSREHLNSEGKPERFPSKIGKFVVESWCYIPGKKGYVLSEEAEIQEIFSKKIGISIFSIGIFIKLSGFSYNFQMFLNIWSKLARLSSSFLTFRGLVEISRQMLIII